MDITIDFQDTLERCIMESTFIGRAAEQQASDELRATNDENSFSRHYIGRFDMVRIRSADYPLIMTYIREGAHKIEAAWKWAMTADGHYTENTLIWTFRDSNNLQDNTSDSEHWLAGLIIDLLTAYALWRWLNDKLPASAETYIQRYENTLIPLTTQLANGIIHKPSKRFFDK